ncbi:partial Potassium transporter KimA, partial [Anaerolineae bacterium]
EMVILHVSTDAERADKLKQKMTKFAPDARLIILDSPYRAFVRPLLAYVDAVHSQSADAFVTIVLPEFITARWWEKYLHNRTATRLRNAFERHPNVAVVLVPYLLEK